MTLAVEEYLPLPKPPLRIPLRLSDALVPIPLTFDFSPYRPCLNAEERIDMWTDDDTECLKDLVSAKCGFLNQLGQICIRAKIQCCFNQYCLEERRKIENIVPKCGWEYFRMWAIEAISCQLNMRDGKARDHIAQTIEFCRGLLEWHHKGDVKYDERLLGYGEETAYVDIAEVCDVIYWIMSVQDRIDCLFPLSEGGKWPRNFVPFRFIRPSYERALDFADEIGLCRNQVRNLRLVAARGNADLPALMEYARQYPSLRHKKHKDCPDSWCLVAHQDSTVAKRYHIHDENGIKCDGNCKRIQFSRQKLTDALDSKSPTAWRNDEKETLDEGETFIAISHVWSDGTGGDRDNPCRVYSCLLNYWRRLSEELGCDGIWWDAICIPGKKKDKYRQKALKRMHHNYAKAEYTVVHDKYLVNFEYKDPSSACLAIVLSPWFTRCWTALELRMSSGDKVKVLFKGRHPGEPDMRSLDEILQCHPAYQPRPHIIAHSLINRLRWKITTATDLLAIMKPRHSSWLSDIKVISALLIGWSNYDQEWSEAKFTRGILRRIGEIEMSALYHGFETMRPRGRFSWCPRSLRDMPIKPTAEFDDPKLDMSRLKICRDGSIEGDFQYRFLTEDDMDDEGLTQLVPSVPNSGLGREEKEDLDKDQLVTYKKWRKKEGEYIKKEKISECADDDLLEKALRNWRNCLLLRANERASGPAILVKTVGKGPSKAVKELEEEFEDEEDDFETDDDDSIGDEEDVIDCRYVVVVQDKTPRAKNRSLWHEEAFSIGRDRKRPDVDARKLLGKSRKK